MRFPNSWQILIIFFLIICNPIKGITEEKYAAGFKGTEMGEFIQIVSKNLNKTMIVDPSIKGIINVRSYDLLTKEQYYQFFLNVLAVYGYAVVEIENGTSKVIQSKDAKFSSIPVLNEYDFAYGDEFITRVIPVRNVSVKELAPLLRQLNDNAGGGNVVNYDPSNVIMLTGPAAVVNRLFEIIKLVDKAGDQQVEIVNLKHASAFEIVRIIETLLHGNNNRGQQDASSEFLMPKLVADERINSVLVSGEPSARNRVIKLIKKLDNDSDNSGNTNVYYLKYAKAQDMVEVLTSVGNHKKESSSGQTSQGGSQNSYQSSAMDEISIDAHEDSNSLVITAQPDMMQTLERVIRQLDIRRAQVLVEAIIVELQEGDGAAFGVQFMSEESGAQQWNSNGQAPISNVWVGNRLAQPQGGSTVCDGTICTDNPATPGDFTVLASVLGSVNGMMVGMLENDWGALVQAVRTSSNSNILATPSITTLDNQEAFFIVGQDVPVLTGSTPSSDNSNPFQTIERHEVGVKLKVTPRINEGNAVQLQIEQEVSGVSGQTGIDITINKREMKTTVMADDRSTIVLGGLIDEDAQESVSRVPFLSRIPLFGTLFKSINSQNKKRNLLVFMRPSIIRDEATMTAISGKKYNFIRAKQLEDFTDIKMLRGKEKPLLPVWNTQHNLEISQKNNQNYKNNELENAFNLSNYDIP